MAPLRSEQLAELHAAFNATTDAETRLRYQMVLLAQQGKTAPEIARLTLRSHETALRAVRRFAAGGLVAVPRRPRPGVAPTVTDAWRAALPRADRDLQDEGRAALHPTLTRLWSRKGRRGQRLVEAPGRNAKVTGFGALDWRDGFFHGLTAPGRRAAPFVAQLDALVARSRARGRLALVLLDNLSTHT